MAPLSFVIHDPSVAMTRHLPSEAGEEDEKSAI